MTEMTLAMASSSTTTSLSSLVSLQFFFSSLSCDLSSRSRSRNLAAFSYSCAPMAASFSLTTSSIFFSRSRISTGACAVESLVREPASSITSMALSGRKRSLM